MSYLPSRQARIIPLRQDRLEGGKAEARVIVLPDGSHRVELTSILLEDDLDAEHVIRLLQSVMPFLSLDVEIDDV